MGVYLGTTVGWAIAAWSRPMTRKERSFDFLISWLLVNRLFVQLGFINFHCSMFYVQLTWNHFCSKHYLANRKVLMLIKKFILWMVFANCKKVMRISAYFCGFLLPFVMINFSLAALWRIIRSSASTARVRHLNYHLHKVNINTL